MGHGRSAKSSTLGDTAPIARPLRVLVPLIQAEIAAGDAAGLAHYRRAGDLLWEAKAQLGHGEWTAWVLRHFELSQRTAIRYMKLAEIAALNGRRRPFSTLSEAVDPPRAHHQAHAPIHTIITEPDHERHARELRERRIHTLAHQIVGIGFKALAAQHHPDKPGGSDAAMADLNEARTLLRKAIPQWP